MRTLKTSAAFVLLSSILSAQQIGGTAAAQSPVLSRIETAQKLSKAKPDEQSFNDLAFAWFRQGRDTGDRKAFAAGEEALRRSFKIAPGNYDAQKLQATVFLGEGQIEQAFALAKALNKKVPDDIGVWALLVDANMALGNYDEAERDAQWILDLRAGSSLGFEKAAGLRERFGDPTGAIEFYDEANRRTSANDADQHAWYLTRKAELELSSGNVHAAEEVIQQALALFPDSQFAAGVLAEIRLAQGRYDEAAALEESRSKKTPSAANLYAWAEALQKAKRLEQARAAFAQFETQAKTEMASSGQPGRELILFLLDEKNDPAGALALASRRSAVVRDSATLDVYAWALFKNGRWEEARVQIDRALKPGVLNTGYLCHATQIASQMKDGSAESRFKQELAGLNANACLTDSPVSSVSEAKR